MIYTLLKSQFQPMQKLLKAVKPTHCIMTQSGQYQKKTNRADRKMTVLLLGLNSESMRIPLGAPMNSFSLPIFLPLAQPPWNPAMRLAHNSAALCPAKPK